MDWEIVAGEGTDSMIPRNVPDRSDRSKRKRLLRRFWVLGAIIGLLVLVWSIPSVLSTSVGRSLLENYVNARIQGSLSIGDLQLSWSGPMVMQNLRVLDPTDREVLTIDEVSYSGDLVAAVRHPERFELIRAIRPVVVICKDVDGSSSLLRAFASTRPPDPDSPRELPHLVGRLLTEQGVVKLVRADGHTYELREVGIDLKMDSLGLIEGTAHLQTSETESLSLTLSLNDLTDGRELKIDRAKGVVILGTDEPVEMGPIAEFLGSEMISGKGELELQGNVSGGSVSGEIAVSISDLRSEDAPQGEAAPIGGKLAGTFQVDPDRISTALHLTSDVGELTGNLGYGGWRTSRGLRIRELYEGILSGRCDELGDLSLRVSGRLDLSELARFDPRILGVLPDVDILSGELDIQDVSIRTKVDPGARGRLDLKDLTARKGASKLRFRPVSLRFDGILEEETGLNVRELVLRSAFARTEARGTLKSMQGEFDVDLREFQEQLGQILKPGGSLPSGRIEGSFALTRRDEDRIDFRIETNARDLSYGTDRTRRIVVDHCSMSHIGYASIHDNTPEELVIARSLFETSDNLQAEGSGNFRFDEGALHYELTVPTTALSDIENILGGFRPSWFPHVAGDLELSIAVDRTTREAGVACRGLARITDLTADDTPITQRPIVLEWANLRPGSLGGKIDADRVSVGSEPLNLAVEGLNFTWDPDIQLRCGAVVSADVAKLISAVRALTDRDVAEKISGSVEWKGRFAPVEGTPGVSTTGLGTIEDLQVSTDKGIVRTGSVRFEHDATFGPESRKLTLRRLGITSNLISGEVKGVVTELGGKWDLDLTGRYEGSWEEIMDLTAQFVPGIKDRVIVSGKTDDDLTILGAAHDPELIPRFRRVKAATGIGWGRAEALGVPIGRAEFATVLSDGMIGVGRQVIDAGTGTVEIGGIIDFRSASPVYRLPGRTQVLDRLTITPELTRDLLARFNPVFAELAEIDGEVSLDVSDLELPLDERIKNSGRGSGHLDLTDLAVRPRGILRELVRLGMLVSPDEALMETPGVDFEIRDGRIHYDDFRLVFPDGFDLKFFGSVGFDDTLDMGVSVPIRIPLLERFGVKGPLTEYIRVVKGLRVVIPLAGTRIKPILDLSEVDIGPVLRAAAELLAAEKAREILEGVLFPPAGGKITPKRPRDREDDGKGLDQLLDPLFDLLRKQAD